MCLCRFFRHVGRRFISDYRKEGGFFGGGDMNGIALLVPELPARLFFGVLFAVNCLIFWKIVLPKYKQSFAQKP